MKKFVWHFRADIGGLGMTSVLGPSVMFFFRQGVLGVQLHEKAHAECPGPTGWLQPAGIPLQCPG